MLVDGKWVDDGPITQRADAQGRFVRPVSTFRHWVTPDGAPGPTGVGGFRAEPNRYHLYIALNCPWACRTLIYRKLKKLEDVISVSIAVPNLPSRGTALASIPVDPGSAYNIHTSTRCIRAPILTLLVVRLCP
jgi:putative glutathione S-transferase